MVASFPSPRPSPLVLFAPAYGAAIGGGHLLRCLALAAAVSARGGRAVFALPASAEEPVGRFALSPVEVRLAPDGAALIGLCAETRPDAVVLDNYALAADLERQLRPHAKVMMAIDDLADRPHVTDLVLDTGYARREADYAGLTPMDSGLLLGPGYALLRPEFAAARARLGPVREQAGRIFISLGLTDVGGVTAAVVEALGPLAPQAELEVVISSAAPSLPALRRRAGTDPRIRLHVDATEVALLMVGADMAIGAGGTSTWERCCLGLPSIALAVADNQLPTVRALEDEGAHLALESLDRGLAEAVARMADPDLRRSLRERSMRVCDGSGADRVAEALLARVDRGRVR